MKNWTVSVYIAYFKLFFQVFMDEPNYLNNLAVDMHKLRFSVASNIQNAVGGLMRDYFHYKVPGLCKMFIINVSLCFRYCKKWNLK